MASSSGTIKQEYAAHANNYNDYALDSPTGVLETQLVDSALGDCKGLTILDLGGGTGARARQAIDHGASLVDLVDLSRDMLRTGQAGLRPEHRDRIRWHEGDCSMPMDLPLQEPGTYDIVMANWVFDHCSSVEQLEGMWRNIALYTKPGGRFLGVRTGDEYFPYAPAAVDGRYGLTYKDWEEIPGGLRFRFITTTDPPFEIEGTSMEISYSGSTELHEKFGFHEVESEPYTNAEVVRQDPEFWKLFLEKPYMVVTKAKKRLFETCL